MSKISVGFSTVTNEASAAAEVVETALRQLEGEPTFAILLSTVDYDVQKILAAVQEKLADAPIWGGTSSAGIISPTGLVSGEQGALGIMLISGIQAGVGGAELGDDPQTAGLKAAQAAIESIKYSPDVLLMMSAPGNEEAVMAGIKQVSKSIP
ncbi:MAG: FIST N-terminal domain-containing protein, partial [Candidatus Poribacteria bacterium]